MNQRLPSFLSVPLLSSLLLVAPIAAIVFASACGRPAAGAPAAVTGAGDAERGRYLVEQVGLCADCHSPRNERGEFLASKWLQGAPIPLKPLVPMPWAEAAPSIAGLPTLPDDAAALHFLTTGELPGGRTPRPPMPPYRFAAEDARHVLAYLRRPDAFRPGQAVAAADR